MIDRAVELAKLFHENYERLAPLYGYETRDESAVPWEDVPVNNRNLMIATCRAVIERADSDIEFLVSLVPKWAKEDCPGLVPAMYGTGSYEGDRKVIERVAKIQGISMNGGLVIPILDNKNTAATNR